MKYEFLLVVDAQVVECQEMVDAENEIAFRIGFQELEGQLRARLGINRGGYLIPGLNIRWCGFFRGGYPEVARRSARC